MTYAEWKAKQDELHGEGTVDKMRRMRYNESADRAQYEAYKGRLGNDAPRTFKAFQTLKYDNSEQYEDLTEHYRYKGRVPEATVDDYRVYKAVKATGIYGTIRVPPLSIDTSNLILDAKHITARGHGVTLKEAISYIENSRFSLTRIIGKGTGQLLFINYYSDAGAAYVNIKAGIIRTAFKQDEYDQTLTASMEAAKNAT